MSLSENGSYAGGFGCDWGWIILLLLFAGGGWGGFGGGYGNAMLGYDFPWLLNGQQGINANTTNGFRDQLLNDNMNSLRDGIYGVSSQIGNVGRDLQMALANGFAGVEQGASARQIADMQTAFANQAAMSQGFNGVQSQLAQCCCDNRLATQDLKYTVATENCADRTALADGIKSILSATQAQTQAILDKMCQDKLYEKNDIISQLRSELMYARGQASQDVQTAAIQAGQRNLANEIEQYVLPTPRPAYVVSNPNCCTNAYGCSI